MLGETEKQIAISLFFFFFFFLKNPNALPGRVGRLVSHDEVILTYKDPYGSGDGYSPIDS